MASTESVLHDDLVVCARGGQDYKARDAIEAALFRGDLEEHWREFARCLNAEKQADETNLELDEDAIDSAAEAFRYEHDLITAEETEQWLTGRGLSLDDFSDYFARRYCGEAMKEKVTKADLDYPSAPGATKQLFAADTILSGYLEKLTTQLSWRLAAAAAEEKQGVPAEAIEAERQNFFKRTGLTPEKLPEWLDRLGRDASWFEEMAKMEAAYQARQATLFTPQSRQREMASLRLQLTRFETEVLELESRDAAQEALFCVREDNMSMEEVATEGRYPYRRVSFLHEDIPAELQQKFLSVKAGDLLEPMPRGDGFELHRISRKIEPKPDDPAIQVRVDHRLLERHFAELTGKYIESRLHLVASSE